MKSIEVPKGKVNSIDIVVSKNLRNKRIMLGLSQHALARAVNVSVQQVQKYEKASNRISSGKLFTLSQFLNVPLNYFFEQTDNASDTISNVLVEDASQYNGEDNGHITEKEIINLIKSFSSIKCFQSRKKIVELVKVIA
jgi:transcriptional regulator with XRE-family HTH domain